jgi:hypothetical protein
MHRNTKLIACLGIGLASWLVATPAPANEQFAVSSIINVPGGLSGFDISFVDPVAGVYVLADSGNKAIDVVDTGSNLVINQLKPGFVGVFTGTCPAGPRDCNGPNGVLIANHTQVWVGDGNSTVWKLQLNNGHVLAKISTALPGTTDLTRADELCYDPDHHIILVANDASIPFPFVTFISSTGNAQVLGQIVMDGTNGTPIASGGIEQCQYDSRTGKFYLNVPQATFPKVSGTFDLVLQIDPVKENIVNTLNLTARGSKCVGVRGMAIGPAPQIAIGCSTSGTASVIISEDFSGVLDLPGEAGADENWFNPGDNHYFFANSTPKLLGVVDALGEDGSSAPVEDTSASSAGGSHSVAADPVGNQVYVPVNNGAGAASKICSTHTDANGMPGVDANGCIAVFTVIPSTGPDDPGSCLQQGGSFANCPPKG